ncbi:hypothetical protein [Leeuwenhoekiella parthenopeia]|uniref:Uncharacterized protein n=1 Tax=Leeuwenhoekiella parthenopeia TaxID=2890320 RepID=A0ABS8GV88_9FLAO|nr:hypothetical protein [Leeuwenhoekiella parthenopeia]MCC4213935.1 hypothetical protein [Leeuwenhoekiella parthenopeia]
MKGKELIFLLMLIVSLLVLPMYSIGWEALHPESQIDVNIHDTYFIIPTLPAICVYIVFIIFSIYLFRVLLQKFRNKIANLILIVSTMALILIFTFLICLFRLWESTSSGYHSSTEGIVTTQGNVWNVVFWILISIQLALVILLVLTAFKTGRLFGQSQKDSVLLRFTGKESRHN